jgi:hypothetical protein
MKRPVIAAAILGAAALAGAVPASASVFDLSFAGTGISGNLALSLSGGGSPYTVTGVDAGSYMDIGSTKYTITGLATYAGDDQTVYTPPSSSQGYVDFAGISMSFGTGDALNFFAFSPTSYGVLLQDQNAVGDPFTGPYYAVTVSDPPPVPEASTWALMLVGFAGLWYAGYRTRRPRFDGLA